MPKLSRILFSLNSLRKALGSQLFFNSTQFDFHIQIIDQIQAKKVLVLAPHPDDDSFGCGGSIRKMATNGSEVTVAYFCDGSGGIPEVTSVNQIFRNKELAETRKKEAKATVGILGISEQVFFGYKDGELSKGKAVIKAVSDLIKRVKPDIIFVPSFIDNHPDHRAVNDILINFLDKNVAHFEIWAYEVWTPIYANRIVLINDEKEAKEQSMLAHQSQLDARGYDKAILGLNQYRAQINNRTGLAEAYFASSPSVYKELYKKSLN
jgi:LmbE family N-acetylglucosaminyl deacetylase